MKRIAFIDHSAHKETLSSAFFVDLLKKSFDVDIYWCDSWKTGVFIDLEKISISAYDVIVFWQRLYPYERIKKYRDKCILIPMFDGARRDSDLFWLKYKDVGFINFSKTLHSRLIRLGLNSMHVKYFPHVDRLTQQNIAIKPEGLSALFWQRSSEISWNLIRRLINGANIVKLHYHLSLSPEEKIDLPGKADTARYGISFTDWFSSREEYLGLVQSSDIYFAPRLYEGIGMSFLEAMALGKCVVAPDNPTMNEYITDGFNGILYNPRFPKPIRFDNLATICKHSLQYSKEGFLEWKNKEKEIINYIINNRPSMRRNDIPFRIYIFSRSIITSAICRPLTLFIKLFDRLWYYLISKGVIFSSKY